jgi:histidinol-phosphatase
MHPSLPALLKIAVEAAKRPSELILSGFRSKALGVERKGDGSPVTEFDKRSELMIREFLSQHAEWPVLGEEFGGDGTDSAPYRWVIDPIDGTLAFSRGLPTFGTLLAFEDVAACRALIGVIHLPALGETYSAAKGGGAWCNGERVQIAPARELKDCIVSAPAEYHFRLAAIAESHEELRKRAPHLRCFADCWAHAMVARGSIDALAEFNLSRWDIAATEILIEEAGGRALVREAPYATTRGKYDCVIGSPRAAGEVASILKFG